jgi:hypothetical protein
MGEAEGANNQAKRPEPSRKATTNKIRARIKKANLATKLLDCKKSESPCKYLLEENGFIKPLAPSDTLPYCESAMSCLIYIQLFKNNLLKKGWAKTQPFKKRLDQNTTLNLLLIYV